METTFVQWIHLLLAGKHLTFCKFSPLLFGEKGTGEEGLFLFIVGNSDRNAISILFFCKET